MRNKRKYKVRRQIVLALIGTGVLLYQSTGYAVESVGLAGAPARRIQHGPRALGGQWHGLVADRIDALTRHAQERVYQRRLAAGESSSSNPAFAPKPRWLEVYLAAAATRTRR